ATGVLPLTCPDMRTLILSDIHANLPAFTAVLEAAGEVDQVWFLGDVVGYGPDPNECIELLRVQPNLQALMGNHDAVLMDFISIDRFNHEAAEAIRVQSRLISQESLNFLELLRLKLEIEDLTLAHGSPRNPIWEYVLSVGTARPNFDEFSTQGCLVGHTHIPSLFILDENGGIRILLPDKGDRWKPEGRFILNPGSVGQPRNYDPRAAFVIWDEEEGTFLFQRVSYDIEAVTDRILQLGIPKRQALRLRTGT
ncbi:MAG TPA: metallophosphoesterase family protein, partial [Anaerolineaceae bacterium]|nr:metallophosphoesterase family protein [Anaerolineaceae bacterium]